MRAPGCVRQDVATEFIHAEWMRKKGAASRAARICVEGFDESTSVPDRGEHRESDDTAPVFSTVHS